MSVEIGKIKAEYKKSAPSPYEIEVNLDGKIIPYQVDAFTFEMALDKFLDNNPDIHELKPKSIKITHIGF